MLSLFKKNLTLVGLILTSNFSDELANIILCSKYVPCLGLEVQLRLKKVGGALDCPLQRLTSLFALDLI